MYFTQQNSKPRRESQIQLYLKEIFFLICYEKTNNIRDRYFLYHLLLISKLLRYQYLDLLLVTLLQKLLFLWLLWYQIYFLKVVLVPVTLVTALVTKSALLPVTLVEKKINNPLLPNNFGISYFGTKALFVPNNIGTSKFGTKALLLPETLVQRRL